MIIYPKQIDNHIGCLSYKDSNIYDVYIQNSYDILYDQPQLTSDFNIDGIWLIYIQNNDSYWPLKIYIPVFQFYYGTLVSVSTEESSPFVSISHDIVTFSSSRYSCLYSYHMSDCHIMNKYIFGKFWKDILNELGVTVSIDYGS